MNHAREFDTNVVQDGDFYGLLKNNHNEPLSYDIESDSNVDQIWDFYGQSNDNLTLVDDELEQKSTTIKEPDAQSERQMILNSMYHQKHLCPQRIAPKEKKFQCNKRLQKFQCFDCNIYYQHMTSLVTHIKVCNGTAVSQFCNDCGNRLTRKKEDHQCVARLEPDLRFLNERLELFECDRCGAFPPEYFNLVNHKARSCERDVKFYCDICGERFETFMQA